MRLICILLPIFITINSFSQGDEFTTIIKNPATSVKDQEETGSCWSYATCSFLESELLRLNKGEYNLSEAFLVFYAYIYKAQNYFLRQGKTSFTTGGLAHDALRIVKDNGIVPYENYKGVYLKDSANDYFEMQDVLEGFLNSLLKSKKPTENWQKPYRALLESYLGNVPEQFVNKSKTYSTLSFSKMFGINFDDYISLTSFAHHPFYSRFILEVPDNYSNGSFYNIPMTDLVQIIDTALLKGFTIVWDGDVSEPTFSAKKKGLAMLPQKDNEGKIVFEISVTEISTDQQIRQIEFERLQTTDDHLMHIIGLAKNKAGKKFYIVKNSWGKVGPYNGYLYMSVTYLRMKTVSIMINKNSLPNLIKKRIDKE